MAGTDSDQMLFEVTDNGDRIEEIIMEDNIVTRTNLTCPNCGHVDLLDIPLDA
jgi:ribosomal protein S27AE